VLSGCTSKVAKSARAHQHTRLERTDRSIVAFDRFGQLGAYVAKMSLHIGNSLIQIPAQIADRLGIFGEFLLPPAVGDCFQQSYERGRGGEDYTLLDALLD